MKDSKGYSKKVQKLHKELKSKYSNIRIEKIVYEDPIEAVINGIISENMGEAQSRLAIKKISENFVDFNELRVSLVDEIVESLGIEVTSVRDIAGQLTTVLRAVFQKYHNVSLYPLLKMGQRPAKQAVAEIEGVSGYVVSYCMTSSLQGHAMPLTKGMDEYLKDGE